MYAIQQEAKVAGASGKNDSPASEAHTPREAVSVRGIVGPRHGGLEVDSASHLTEVWGCLWGDIRSVVVASSFLRCCV